MTDVLVSPIMTTILEPHGFLELQKTCADDLDVVNAARVSLAKYSSEMGKAEDNLIGFLMTKHHTSPFEHNYFKFRIRAPISVAREWVRHRIGIAWNEESGRYVELRPDAYIPAAAQVRTQKGKPGAYHYEQIEDEALVSAIQLAMEYSYKRAYQDYQDLLETGLAREVARNVLPVGLFTEYIWSCNAHSLMHFLTLRNAPDAMEEIRLYASEMERMWGLIMPISHKWFIENGG